jgi:hypothetical protein
MRPGLIAAFASLPVLAAAQAPAPLDAGDQRQAVAEAQALLRRNYVVPETGARAAERIGAAFAAGDYGHLHDPSAFAARVTRDLEAVTEDPHVAMIARVDAPTGPAPARTEGGFSRVDRLKGGVGYVKLDRFPPFGLFKPFADEMMAKLADTDALIVDLRDNSGGAASSVTYFAGFFFAEPTHVGDLVNRTPGAGAFTTTALWTVKTPTAYLGKPVYLLTSPRTFSGGEELADDLQAQKRAVVVGEATEGAANPGLSWPLLGGRLRLFVPSSRAENPVTRSNWAGSGVKPDVAVPETMALETALARVVADLEARGEGGRLAPLTAGLARGTATDKLVQARLLAFRDKPQPGGERALRRLIDGIARGEPDYAWMESDIAAATRRMAPQMQADLERLGPVKGITFHGVGIVGGDEYDVRFEGGTAVWMIYQTRDGRLAAYAFGRPQ